MPEETLQYTVLKMDGIPEINRARLSFSVPSTWPFPSTANRCERVTHFGVFSSLNWFKDHLQKSHHSRDFEGLLQRSRAGDNRGLNHLCHRVCVCLVLLYDLRILCLLILLSRVLRYNVCS